MNGLVSNIILSATVLMLSAQQHLPQSGNVGGGLPCGPVPSENQLRWQDMEMYAFTHYRIAATTDWQKWETLGEGEFSNIVNNPIWQTVRCNPTRAKVIRVEGLRLAQGGRMGYNDVEVLTDK